jgi:hypothetical protein
MVHCLHVDLHSIGTMMGFHAVKLWQNETFHFLYHIYIIIQTHFNSQMAEMEAKTLHGEHRGGLLPCGSTKSCLSFFPLRGATNIDVTHGGGEQLVTSLMVAENN